jgi:succinate dehydrogenase hydrophobic anchor subunit
LGLVALASCQSVASEFVRYCDGQAISVISDPNDLEYRRSKLTGVSVTPSDFGGVIRNGNVRELASSKLGVYLILVMIVTAALLVSTFWFLGFCCCLDKSKTPRESCSMSLILGAVMANLALLLLLFAACVFAGVLNRDHSSAVCSIYRVPNDFMNGVKLSPNRDFIGLSTFSHVLGNFTQSLPKLPSLSGSFSSIASKPFSGSTSSALQSLRLFSESFRSATTWDGRSLDLSPTSVRSLTREVNAEIAEEFRLFDNAASSMEAGAQEGVRLTQMNSLSPTGNSIVSNSLGFKSQIDRAKQYFDDNLSVFFKFTGNVSRVSKAIYVTVVVVAFLVVSAMGAVSFWALKSTIAKQDKCRRLSKSLLVGSAFVGFLLGLAAIFTVTMSTAVFTICKDVPLLLGSESGQVSQKLSRWGFTVSPDVSDWLNNCIGYNSKGSLFDSAKTDQSEFGNSTLKLLDGITAFRSIRNYVDRTGSDSPPIDRLARQFEYYKTSFWSDQPNALLTLNELNKHTRCGGVSFALNSKNCTSARCSPIFQTVNIPALPACSAEQATKLYKSLLEFVSQQHNLLARMLFSLKSEDPNSLSQQQKRLRLTVRSFDSDYSPVVAQLGGFLAVIPNVTGGLLDVTNCTMLRTELMNFEANACFKFNNNIYYFSSILCSMVFLVLVIVWLLYCSMFCMGIRIETMVASKPQLQQQEEAVQIKGQEEEGVY